MKLILRTGILGISISFIFNCGITLPDVYLPKVNPPCNVNSSAGQFTYTNFDGKPEMTSVPVVNPTSISRAILNSVTATVPVDADTGYISVCVRNRAQVNTCMNSAVVISGSAQTVSVDIPVLANQYPVSDYVFVEVMVSISSNDFLINNNFNSYSLFSNLSSGTTYEELLFTGGTGVNPVDTCVTAPTLTINP